MNIRNWHGKIGNNYGWEFEWFYMRRSLSDGITFFELMVNLDKYPCDHNPKFEFGLTILNLTIFDFHIYNIWHMDNPSSPYYSYYMDDAPDYEKDNKE
jgi:hypothetical protein